MLLASRVHLSISIQCYCNFTYYWAQYQSWSFETWNKQSCCFLKSFLAINFLSILRISTLIFFSEITYKRIKWEGTDYYSWQIASFFKYISWKICQNPWELILKGNLHYIKYIHVLTTLMDITQEYEKLFFKLLIVLEKARKTYHKIFNKNKN